MRYEGNREDAAIEGFDLNNYNWLDSTPLCLSIDWAQSGKVSAVKDQLTCGSCWAHTVTAAVEVADAIKHRLMSSDDVKSLSEQQLLDCNLIPNVGCLGGKAQYAYRYVKENGLALSSAYPYKNKLRACEFTPEMKAVGMKDFKMFEQVRNDDLKKLTCQGAISTYFYINDCIKNYSGGIITDFEEECDCSGKGANHAVTIVGFGQDGLNMHCKKYWLVKNSWGQDWGENGYMRVCRDDDQIHNGTCNIREQAIIPILH